MVEGKTNKQTKQFWRKHSVSPKHSDKFSFIHFNLEMLMEMEDRVSKAERAIDCVKRS